MTQGWELTVAASAEVTPGPLRRIRDLCEDRRAEAVDGGRTDVDTIWPSEILAILDESETPQ